MHRMGSVSKSIVLIGSLRNIFEFAFMFGVEGVLGFSVREETVDSMYDIPVKEIDITETLALAKKREVFLVVCDANRERWNEIISSNQLKYQEQFLWFEDFFESLNRFHKESLGKRQIAIWGVGDTQVNLQRDLEKRYGEITISCYIDGNDDSTAGELNGRPVYHVSDISDISKYFIIVASVYYFEIKDRLQEMGLREDIDFLPFSAFKTNPREMMKTLVSAPQREEFYCTNPYTFFYYAWHDTYPCCSTWVRYPIGNPMTDPPEACWNSVVAKMFRLSVENHTYCFCIPEACEIWEAHIKHPKPKTWEVPKSIVLGLDYTCNLYCSSCRNEQQIATGGQLSLREDMAERIIRTGWLEKADTLELSGTGEALFSKVDRKILFSNVQQRKSIILYTNGLLLNRENCELLARRYEKIGVKISFDATKEETYRKIRRGGDWNRLMENLKIVSEYRKTNRFHYVEIRMVVQRDNYKEIPDFIKMCHAFRFDKVHLAKMLNWNMYSDEDYYYASMIDRDGRMDEDLRRIFDMPELREPVVIKTQFLRYLLKKD